MATADSDPRLDTGFVIDWLQELSTELRENRDYLTQLDAAIGDADHGINMDRGVSAALAKAREMRSEPPGRVLETVGTTLTFSVGGAAGPLYGTGLRDMGRALGDGPTFGAEDLLRALRAGLGAIQTIGAASEGDKTMVDAFAPALAGFERGLRGGDPLLVALGRARRAAEEGMRATVPMQAKKGRASYLGPRSVGHQDPGATSVALLFASLERAADGAVGRSGGHA
ncbi:MAG: dihydroxyacetone kinase subunit DhaL [Candidatus Velamenicoccus archaeovorus]